MKNITSAELQKQMESAESPIVVDVRSLVEYTSGHLPGARHFPFWKSPFQVIDVSPTRADLLVLYCEHGPRAVLAGKLMQVRGFRNIVLLKGHMNGWRREGRPISCSNNIDRED